MNAKTRVAGSTLPGWQTKAEKCTLGDSVNDRTHEGDTGNAPTPRYRFKASINGIDYSAAQDATSVDEILQLRYRVLVNSDGYFARNDTQRITDGYDLRDNTVLIQARRKTQLIGSVRLVTNGEAGIPSDRYFDIRGALQRLDPGAPILDAMIADLNRIVVEPDLRNKQIGYHLMTIGHLLGIENGAKYFIGISNPRTMTLFVNRLGWQQVGEQRFDSVHGVPYIPIIGIASRVKVYGRE